MQYPGGVIRFGVSLLFVIESQAFAQENLISDNVRFEKRKHLYGAGQWDRDILPMNVNV